MFQRLTFESWQLIFPVIGFVLFFTVFIVVTVRAMLAKKKSIERDEALPLEKETSVKDSHGRI